MSKQTYKLKYYPQGGWAVVKVSTIGDKNPVTGVPTKNAGEVQEVVMGWPGMFKLAGASLMKYLVADGTVVENIDDWKRVHEGIKRDVQALIEEWRLEQKLPEK